MKKILIIGIDSLIGNSILKSMFQRYLILGTTRRYSDKYHYLDLAQGIDTWPEIGSCDFIIFCGSINTIEGCKQNEDLSYRVNVASMKDVIRKYKKNKTKLIFFSSSHVFDGKKNFYTEADKPNPFNILGIHKLQGEEIILNEKGLVIRLTKVLDYNFPRFINWCILLKKNESLKVFSNLTVSLIPIDKIISFLSMAIENSCPNIVHLSGPEEKSYYEIAKMIAKNFKFDDSLIYETTGHTNITGRKYYNSCLKTSTIVNEFGIEIQNTKQVINNWCNYNKNFINK